MRKNTLASLIWVRITRFTHQSALLSNENVKKYDITAAQFDVLNQIGTYQPLSQSELADKITISAGGISRMLSRLEREGYIERTVEWKTKWISLTEKGQIKLDEVFEDQLDFQTSLMDECLTKAEQKKLYALVTKVQKHTEKKLNS
ncbi:DNA-binding transcriptional regulator, MarR family [Alkalibacterium putridalgicola]|uniref:DNA-binding transcriptional regulator, MarR family n=1 Tax=Alkalibacterium putridalgicola TaxID=426703 RepID=A0A1H7TSD8_9LACT|nr:MarR family transcriptional regulator [Alkalibacterium putridalgicola]GEK90176.1 putative HTH-type transcriptional regulator [Alkalibacterium putridalgicola]SEL87760.1 DNA-binding transcriptional regulator, MarR family [Alkalibacterium putridalgicola]